MQSPMDAGENKDNYLPGLQEQILQSKESAKKGKAEKKCIASKKYYWLHREKLLERKRKYRAMYPERERATNRRHYARNQEQRCADSRKYHHEHREQRQAYHKAYRLKNIEQIRKKLAEYYQKNIDKLRENSRLNRQKNLKKRRAQCIEWNRRTKKEVLEAYGGPICKCCGKTDYEFLSMDHIENGRGNPAQRPRSNLYAWLKAHNFPSGFQVLCIECNQAKNIYGTCPHTKIKTPIDLFLQS